MRIYRFLAATVLAWGLCSSAIADEGQPTPECTQPYKPSQFNSQQEYDSFMQDVNAYKQCITDFVNEQRAAAKLHQDAANAAVDEWNNFKEQELK